MVRIPSITADRIQGVRWCSISGWKRLQVYFPAHQTVHYLDVLIRSYAHFSNCCQKLKDARTSHEIHWSITCSHLLKAERPYLYIYLVPDNEKTDLILLNSEYTNSWSFVYA
jgi:hypothetical protein